MDLKVKLEISDAKRKLVAAEINVEAEYDKSSRQYVCRYDGWTHEADTLEEVAMGALEIYLENFPRVPGPPTVGDYRRAAEALK